MIRVTIITVSDRSSSGLRTDLSGPALRQQIELFGWKLVNQIIIPDEIELIQKELINNSSGSTDLILTTGGTGFAPRDVTPEATLSVLDKRTFGLVEKIRYETSKNNIKAILSRAEAGIRNECLIINLPGNPSAAVECLQVVADVIPHAIHLIQQHPDSEEEHKNH